MIPTLKIGDFLFVNKMRYSFRMPFTEKEIIRFDNPKRGDIVTFIPPEGAVGPGEPRQGLFSKRFVKRIVGMPGDTIRITRKPWQTDRGIVNYAVIEFKPVGREEFLSYNPVGVPALDHLKDLDNIDASQRSLFIEEKPGFEHFVLEGREDDRRGHFLEYCSFHVGCQIPEDHYMVMGDNRDDSHDSRAWGFVNREDILGKAMVLYFSVDWRDNTCEYASEADLYENGPMRAKRLQPDDLSNKCDPYEVFTTGYRQREDESNLGWLKRTLRYRLWRAEVRWDRIGKILK